jgi:hypothetical protein
MKPGSVISALRMLPPIQGLRSKTPTFSPHLPSSAAPTKLEMPLPTKIAS